MIAGVLIVVIVATVAFFTLDLFFRFMNLAQPRHSLRRAALWYSLVAGLGSGLGLWQAWVLGGPAGLLIALAGTPVWWVLWRFGVRKQFPYLFLE